MKKIFRHPVFWILATPLVLIVCLVSIVTVIAVSDLYVYRDVIAANHKTKQITGSGDLKKSSDQMPLIITKHSCQACHGRDLKGKQLGDFLAPDITSSGSSAKWSQQQFIHAMRTGQRPDGQSFNSTMPWKSIGQASDEDLITLWKYLQAQ
jgi:cytochrome c553